MLDAATAAIVERLSPLRNADLLVRSLPNSPAEAGEIVGNGVITVSWMLDEAQSPQASGSIRQNVLTKWMIDGRIRALRDDAGLGALREGIYSLLLGFSPTGLSPLYAERFEFVERSPKFWRFEAVFIARTVIFETGTEAIGPLLQAIEFVTEVEAG